jgi:hypothetical protein
MFGGTKRATHAESTAAAISIQFWAWKPKIVKCPVRNCTSPIPFLMQPTCFARKNILFLYLCLASFEDSSEGRSQLLNLLINNR